MNKNKEELLARIKCCRRKVISLLEESDRLLKASQNFSTYEERVEAQKRIAALNDEAFAEKALADELMKEISSDTVGE